MRTLSTKVPAALRARLVRVAKRHNTTVSAVVRQALQQYVSDHSTFAEAAKRYIGCLDFGPGDLATNLKHLAELTTR